MSSLLQDTPSHNTAVLSSCKRIAPSWPLDRSIAVNPFWGFVESSPERLSGELAALSGARLHMRRDWYRARFSEGVFGAREIASAIAELNLTLTVEDGVAALEREEVETPRSALVTDLLDASRDLARSMSWSEVVLNQLSQLCAAYFDEGQATVRIVKDEGLYATWRRYARADRGPALLMDLDQYRAITDEVPEDAESMIALAVDALELGAGEQERYFTALLLSVNGWASWCAYLAGHAGAGRSDGQELKELLAMRIAWEWMLYRSAPRGFDARWRMGLVQWSRPAPEPALDWVFQRALEIAYREDVAYKLVAAQAVRHELAERPLAQAVFCIDVRSEPMRRALEEESRCSVQTMGFAGFFGMPIEYQPVGGHQCRPQLPGPLSPALRVTDQGVESEPRVHRLHRRGAWKALKSAAISGFSFVESFGLLYGAKILGDSFGLTRPVPDPEVAALSSEEVASRRPRLTHAVDGSTLNVGDRVALAAKMLRSMSLTENFGRFVVLFGHGAQMVNAPHAASMDCGACCGQSGEVNARAAAHLFNDPMVRQGLAEEGWRIPVDTVFLAGLHNTTTDELALFDEQEAPSSHANDLRTLKVWLEKASEAAARRRAPRLGLPGDASAQERMRRRSREWSQVRPEWGLANNAAFIVAPRAFTRDIDLEGRSFLHDYVFEEDVGFATLELIMTAPMVVTHWINLQYFASTVDPLRYGSGNKTLHNVVGGHVGVFEGNGGDLRIGLPLQSVHDGDRFVHTPVRLSVFIRAPQKEMDRLIAKHAIVRQLVENDWLALVHLGDDGQCAVRRGGDWVPIASAETLSA